MTKNIILFFLTLTLFFSATVMARSSQTSSANSNPRTANLSGEDKEMFKSLTDKQQKNIIAGKIEVGYNAWMVTLAVGEPYYKSEHHPVYVNYEQVWLYTRKDEDKEVKEEKIIDPETNWPSTHRYVRTKTCQVGAFFVLFDRGVVEEIVKDKSNKTYGSCKITTHEEFIPIVDNSNRRKRRK